MFTPHSIDDDAVRVLAHHYGLAPAALFNQRQRGGNGQHSVLLDGPLGSFAISTGADVDPYEASSWAWSSNLPHHVLIRDQDVQVTRRDRPNAPRFVSRKEFENNRNDFFDDLRKDRVQDDSTMVMHAMDLFRRVRSAVSYAGMPDEYTTTAYLGILAAACEGYDPTEINRSNKTYALPDNFSSIVGQLPSSMLDAMMENFASKQIISGATLKTYPSLALRHASGAIFQEAHHSIVRAGAPDMFEGVNPARSKQIRRGVVHFTPPSLARSLAEQALSRLTNLHDRSQITIADITCGSGAFLIECLRALERQRYSGRVCIIGRDKSTPAVHMARFVLGIATAEWPGSARSCIDIGVQDTFAEACGIEADIMVLNPPFLSWNNQNAENRDQLRKILGDTFEYRPDASMGFVARALDGLRADGVLAALVPASTLETAAGARWRARLTERHKAGVVARFDNLSIFPEAMVRVGALVLGGEDQDPIQVHSGAALEAVGDVLRALRRGDRGDDATPKTPATWTIRPLGQELRVAPGRPSDVDAWWSKAGTVPFDNLFNISQGIRTGANKTFLLSARSFARLPSSEREAFSPAVTSDDIVDGRIVSRSFVFYPYFAPFDEIASAEQLAEALPTYTALYLGPARAKLMARTRVGPRWWRLAEPRRDVALNPPMFIVKYFAGPGSVALSLPRSNLVAQGFGWTPTESFINIIENVEQADPSPLMLAYLSFFNSQSFFEIVAAHSNITNGGQFDMSHRYTSKIPIIDLSRIGSRAPKAMQTLVDDGYAIYSTTIFRSRASEAAVNAAVRELYKAASEDGESVAPTKTDLQPNRESAVQSEVMRPVWLQTYLDAERQPQGRKHRVAVLCALMEKAKSEDFDEIDVGLRSVDVAELNDQGLVTLLRGTFAMRQRLKFWSDFRDQAIEEFEIRGRDVNIMMIGLDK